MWPTYDTDTRMERLLGTRVAFGAITLACATLLGVGYYLQFADGLEPCPMCIFQRVCYIVITVLALAWTVYFFLIWLPRFNRRHPASSFPPPP